MNRSGLLVSVVAAVALVAVVGVIAGFWTQIGDSDISLAGWLAMALGVIMTLAVGIGLMALVFISNRRGYDEQTGTSRPADVD